MPYNNTAIPPSEEITGSAILPRKQASLCVSLHRLIHRISLTLYLVARVKKTIAADEDIGAVAATAAFVITKATVSQHYVQRARFTNAG